MSQTVGQASYALLQKRPEKINVIDMQKEMQKSFSREMAECIHKNKEIKGLYYILVIFRRERTMPNVIRQQFVAPRFTKPKPNYDTSLYSYNNKTQEFKYYWTIPDEDSCIYLMTHQNDLPKEEKRLLEFVKSFVECTLD